jgi:GrpB-like predicted nucleotidyltransferase (UPF0157 family)
LETPLLIPSFSSKGFQRADGSSAIEDVYRLAVEFVTGVQLVSAYDLHHGHLPRLETMAAKPELTVLDSGGYEIARDDDLSAVFRSNIKPKPWDVEALKHEHAVWPRAMPAIFVSYDNPRIRQPFLKQVQSARQLFRASPDQLHALLIKPESRKQHTLESVLRTVCAHATELCSFDVVGVTEKELGATMLERMQRIAKLREALDEQGSSIPIHVFGALDPIACCVYFIAGAIQYGEFDARGNFRVIGSTALEIDDGMLKARWFLRGTETETVYTPTGLFDLHPCGNYVAPFREDVEAFRCQTVWSDEGTGIPVDELITVVPYAPAWQQMFEEERGFIAMLGITIAEIEHFGSTAVQGLPAQPVVDILAGVQTLSAFSGATFRTLGYDFLGEVEMPGRLCYRKRPTIRASINLHVVQIGGEHWERGIALRDFLRSHPDEARAYAEHKLQCLNQGAWTLLHYSERKARYMNEVADRAVAWKRLQNTWSNRGRGFRATYFLPKATQSDLASMTAPPHPPRQDSI